MVVSILQQSGPTANETMLASYQPASAQVRGLPAWTRDTRKRAGAGRADVTFPLPSGTLRTTCTGSALQCHSPGGHLPEHRPSPVWPLPEHQVKSGVTPLHPGELNWCQSSVSENGIWSKAGDDQLAILGLCAMIGEVELVSAQYTARQTATRGQPVALLQSQPRSQGLACSRD